MRPLATSFIALSFLAVSACSQKESPIRHYSEIAIEPPAREMPASAPGMAAPGVAAPGIAAPGMAAPAAGKLAWTCPTGWIEQPGSNMRLATFLVGPDKSECTIVSFPGDAGGVKANIRRWLGQLHLDVADDALDPFLRKQPAITTKGGFPCTVFDFSELAAQGDAHAPSMLAGMAAAGGETVFVKLTGPLPLLAQEKENFASLCQSLDGRHE